MTNQPTVGLLEWLRPGEHERAERLLDDLKALNIRHLRTQFSWADWHAPGGAQWYDWVIPRLAREVELLPCFTYTPPSLGIRHSSAAPPRDPKALADFLDLILTRLGRHFEWVELWNEPNNLNDWDWRLDPQWDIFSDMIRKAAYWARQRGKKTVLGGMCPTDPIWLDLMCRQGVMAHMDAVGIHGFPGTWEFDWKDWSQPLDQARQVLDHHDLGPELWITEAGYSTGRHDEARQLQAFLQALKADARRLYWYSAHDLHPDECHQDGYHEDERHYHFGLTHWDGRAKLLYRIWAREGLDGVVNLGRLEQDSRAALPRRPVPPPRDHTARPDPVLITGGAGFVGVNLAHRLAADGPVLILDNLSRPGVEENLRRLLDTHGGQVRTELADIRDPHLLRSAVRACTQVFHFAAQVAVTTSLNQPGEDFQINAQGTFHLLEALRSAPRPLLFTSTNKVYGDLGDLDLERAATRYQPRDTDLRQHGVGEDQPLSFHSPYGCSKGAADQYVLDHARCYDLPAVVLRMSCIYGPHQFGTEDQGWVAHFLIRALEGQAITLYGDGYQVRDVLFVDDLLDAMLGIARNINSLKGQVFNVGGGPGNTVSLLELVDLIGELRGRRPDMHVAPWRAGDQRYYVSDIRRLSRAIGWQPQVSVPAGVERLYHWLARHRGLNPMAPPLAGLAN